MSETKTYRCVVVRKQTWTLEVEARSEDEAKEKADLMACHEEAHDDYAYETTAREI